MIPQSGYLHSAEEGPREEKNRSIFMKRKKEQKGKAHLFCILFFTAGENFPPTLVLYSLTYFSGDTNV